MIITRTPYRISLFGGGTDHPAWFQEHCGRVVSFAINKFCYITTRDLPPFFDHKYRIAYSRVETVGSFEEIEHPVVRESIRRYAPKRRLEVHHDGDLPARSGIGSSSAFAVGMINSLLALQQRTVAPTALADLAIEMEHEILKENVGWQDQIACSIGGINFIEFGPERNWQSMPIRLKSSFEQELTDRMVLIFTGINRNSTDITAGLLSDLNMSRKRQHMFRVMKIASEGQVILQSSGDLDLIGEMLDESWQLKKSLNNFATNSLLDNWYERGQRAGSLGGKVLGAGGGGFILFWVKKGEREDFIKKMGPVTVVPISICHYGASVIYRGSNMGVDLLNV